MSVLVVLGVGLLGGLGAVARFVLDGAVGNAIGRFFPFGTLAVNLSGTFALGVLVGVGPGSDSFRLAGTGLLGAFTTFSTWAFESHRLAEGGQRRLAALNFGLSLGAGLALAWLGRKLGGAL